MERDLKALISQMTLEEKAGMCSGKDFWRLKGIERLGIPEVMVSDGPHGLRKQSDKADHLGVNDSIPAVCFPAACATACSFDRDALRRLGEAIGDECQAEDVSVILGPAVNIKRSPLCGRNFEYFSEDPYVASEMATAHIKGVQSRNVGTSLKHFAANNQEFRRMSCSAQIDERTLREIYLAAFEGAVKEAKPKTMMCSYNRVNGVFASENHKLLTDILRNEWGFEGYVMSDWGAVNERVKGLEAGLDLEMPGNGGRGDAEIVSAVQSGALSEEILDRAVERILRVIFSYADHRQAGDLDLEAHHELAGNLAEQSIVLLKNESVLPLEMKGQRIAFIGEFAEKPRFQGGGSSHIHAFKVESALDAVKGFENITYAQGYKTDTDQVCEELQADAVRLAAQSEVAVVFAGLPDSFESEGYDRSHMRLPDCQNKLIEAVCNVQPNVIVVLHNGSPVELPWVDRVKGILEVYLCGQAVGSATVRILSGDVNPSGKLAETFPVKLSDTPAYLNFPGDGKQVHYAEGVYVGYRYYDKKEMDVLYPFGHGLSYTTFEYTGMRLSAGTLTDEQKLTVEVTVKNTGDRRGKEVVQLYVADRTQAVASPVKVLRNFEKIELDPQEEGVVVMELDRRSFAYYEPAVGDWFVPSGSYGIMVGSSSRDIRLTQDIEMVSKDRMPLELHWNTTIGELMDNEKTRPVIEEHVAERIRQIKEEASRGGAAAEAITEEMELSMIVNSPLRTYKNFNQMSDEQIEELMEKLREALRGPGKA